ncbi:IS30 family transposase [Mycoplasmopsis cynos]|uniref:IS30 family transposase n=1 Tax=Mycoplasmopsis cynos TaxID=171284 RepID=UPI002AFE9FD8|nr:IS30 family transposase [Mycoplasmopsis cynos]WQQ18169.1 IS30 family transposase [Mycoplasmopsis cynos]WQQ18240.1 IS30 family transposase [Mycoplasmopsis cynos]
MLIINYKHFNLEKRIELEILLKKFETPISEISQILGYTKSSVLREIKNNSTENGYIGMEAHNKHLNRIRWKEQIKLINNINKYEEFTNQFILKFNKKYFGVDLTHFYIQHHFKFKIPTLRTVFNWINSGLWVLDSKQRLRKYNKGRKTHDVVKTLVGNRIVKPIWTRGFNKNFENEFGHWEIDLIVGKRSSLSSHLLTFTERKTRWGLIIKLENKNPWKLILKLWEYIKIYKLNVKSITTDNGFEFKALFYIGYRLNIPIYQADPYASFQRGLNENFNGLVRREFPKGTNFNKISEKEIYGLQKTINNMPRKIHNYFSADELFFNLNYRDEPWKEIPKEEPLYIYNQKKRTSNTSRNLFLKK